MARMFAAVLVAAVFGATNALPASLMPQAARALYNESLYQGDIMFKPGQVSGCSLVGFTAALNIRIFMRIKSIISHDFQERAAIIGRQWTNGIVPYYWGSSMSK